MCSSLPYLRCSESAFDTKSATMMTKGTVSDQQEQCFSPARMSVFQLYRCWKIGDDLSATQGLFMVLPVSP